MSLIPLPYRILGAGIAMAAMYGMGRYQQHGIDTAAQEAASTKDQLSIAGEIITATKSAAQSAATIAAAIGDARASISAARARTSAAVREVSQHVQDHPLPAACVQPGPAVRLHTEAVAESQAISSGVTR